MTEKKKESHSMGLRLERNLYERLENRASEYNVKKSRVIHDALNQWLSMKESLQSQTFIKIGTTFFRFLINELSDDKILEIAQEYAQELYNKIKFRLLDAKLDINLENISEYMEPMLKLEGHGWFTKFNIRENIDENQFHVIGLHQFPKNFSIFTFELFKTIFGKIMDYQILEDMSSFTESSIDLTFTL